MKRKLLKQCLDIARNKIKNHPEYDCYLHYTFIIQREQILDWGYNRKSSPLIGYPEHGKLHAEPDAWFQARGLIEKDLPFVAVNVRLSRDGRLKVAKPCACCYRFLERQGCKEVWFSTELGFAKIGF